MAKSTGKPQKKPAASKKTPPKTAAHFHEAARVARRAGKPAEVVESLLESARKQERAAR